MLLATKLDFNVNFGVSWHNKTSNIMWVYCNIMGSLLYLWRGTKVQVFWERNWLEIKCDVKISTTKNYMFAMVNQEWKILIL